MDAFLYRYDPFLNGKTGKKIHKPIINQEIKIFEEILVNVLNELSFNIQEFSRFDYNYIKPKKSSLSLMFHGDKEDFPDVDLFYMQMHLKNQFQLDRSGWGMSNGNLLNLNYLCRNNITDDNSGIISIKSEMLKSGTKLRQSNSLFSRLPPEDYLLVALQTPGDTVLKKYSNMSVNDLIRRICDFSRKNKINFLIKPHPNTVRNRSIIPHLFVQSAISGNIKIYMGDVVKAIENAKGVVVLNSGVGFEALLYNKPVYTFAEADYSVAAHTPSEMRFKDWCLELPVKNTDVFFNEYVKYNIFTSKINNAKHAIKKIIIEAMQKT